MAIPQLGSKAPDFTLKDQDEKEYRISSYHGQWIILYFYPKDDTPGCTKEACSMQDNLAVFKKKNVAVLGVSCDNTASHQKFAAKYQLQFPLLADVKKEVVNAYGVYGKKMFMGREVVGIRRTTFLISPEGKIAKVYENVKPEGHGKEVLRDIR